MLVVASIRRAAWQAAHLAAFVAVTATQAAAQSAAQPAAAAQSAISRPASAALENLSIFAGLDGSKQPQDLGINANMGIRLSANWGFPLSDRANLGGQIGAAYNASDAAVHVLDQIEGTSRRQQTYLTAGIFQRPSDKLSWGLAYDLLFQHYYDDFTLSQFRGQVGYKVAKSNEVGAWFAKNAAGDEGTMGTTAVHLDPITQVSGYTRITWASQAQTTLWAGVAAGHENVVWVFPDNSRSNNVLVYGAELQLPLNDRFSVMGAANFLTPTSTGTVDAYLGLAFYPGRGAVRAARSTYAPLTTVANSPTMSVNLRR
jgi:hypothetical protein